LLEDVTRGAYQLEPFSADDIEGVLAVLNRYADLDIGIADASLVVLSERHDTVQILTLDERLFRALRGPRGRSFEVLPADSAA
jgi:hypothetical protein